jgi:hypothetical protein
LNLQLTVSRLVWDLEPSASAHLTLLTDRKYSTLVDIL